MSEEQDKQAPGVTTGETKTRAIALVVRVHDETQSFFRALPPADLDRPVYGEGDGWKVRDLIPHLALWQQVSTLVAQKIARVDTLPDTADWDVWAGELTPTPELNHRTFLEWQGRPIERTLTHLRDVNAGLLAALERLRPEHIAAGETLPDDLHPYLRAPGVRHPRTHLTHARTSMESGPQVEAKERAIAAFERTYADVERKLRALGAEQLDRPVWTGEGEGWRVRDIVPHLARWNRIGSAAARLIATGKEPLPEADMRLRAFIGLSDTVDAVNDAAYREWRDREPEACFTELQAAHTAFMDALRVLPAVRVVKDDREPYRYFWTPGAGHLQLHWEHIEAALKESPTT